MKFKVEFMDKGIHDRIFQTIRAEDWVEIDKKAEAELMRLVAQKRLHSDHAFVGSITVIE